VQLVDYQKAGEPVTGNLSLPVAMELNRRAQLFMDNINKTLEEEKKALEEMQATEKITERSRHSHVVKAVNTLAPHLETLCNKLGFDYLKSKVDLSKEDLDKDMAQFTTTTDRFKRYLKSLRSIEFVKSLEAKTLEPTVLSLVGAIKDIARATSLDLTFLPEILDCGSDIVMAYLSRVETCTGQLSEQFETDFGIFKELVEKYRSSACVKFQFRFD
jgi:hypothetical protein